MTANALISCFPRFAWMETKFKKNKLGKGKLEEMVSVTIELIRDAWSLGTLLHILALFQRILGKLFRNS